MRRTGSTQSVRGDALNSLMVFAGSSHPQLAQEVAQRLGIAPGKCVLGTFSNRETRVQVMESVRDMDVFIIQSGYGGPVNDNFVEMLIMVNACKIASAAKVTAVIPCFPYSRQPEGPYKRNGEPKMVTTSVSPQQKSALSSMTTDHSSTTTATDGSKILSYANVAAAPVTPSPISPDAFPTVRQQMQQMEVRHQKKLKELTGDMAAVAVSPGTASPRSTSPSPGGSPGARDRRLQLQSTVDPANHSTTTVVSSPINQTTSGLGLARSGYKHWTARTNTLVANLLMVAGADAVISMDLHDPQFQGCFDIPFDNLRASPLIMKYIHERVPNYKEALIVSPDAGGAKKATSIANHLGMGFAMIHKELKNSHGPNGAALNSAGILGPSYNVVLVGKVRGKVCVLVDDMADTCNTIVRAAELLVAKGAAKVYAIITHGILSGDAIDRIQQSKIDELIVSNTVPQTENIRRCSKIKVFDVGPLFAEAIRRIHNGESVSVLFKPPEFLMG